MLSVFFPYLTVLADVGLRHGFFLCVTTLFSPDSRQVPPHQKGTTVLRPSFPFVMLLFGFFCRPSYNVCSKRPASRASQNRLGFSFSPATNQLLFDAASSLFVADVQVFSPPQTTIPILELCRFPLPMIETAPDLFLPLEVLPPSSAIDPPPPRQFSGLSPLPHFCRSVFLVFSGVLKKEAPSLMLPVGTWPSLSYP